MSATDREVSAAFLGATLHYVARAVGPEAVDVVLADAGLSPDERPADGWTSIDTTLAVAEAAARLTGDGDLGWRVGEQLVLDAVETGLAEFIRQSDSVVEAFRGIADYGSRMSGGRTHRLVDGDHEHVVIESHYLIVPPDDFFCRLQAGYYAAIPSLFGGTATAYEAECELRGDACCRFVVRWRDARTDEQVRGPASARTEAIVQQFEDLEGMASELASARDSGAALERILTHAGSATMAPRFLLCAQTATDVVPRTYARGLADDEVSDAAAAVRRGDQTTRWGRPITVDVHGSHSHASLTAFVPEGTEPTEAERRLLRAYVGHAAAVLETAYALECSRRERDTAHILLKLAHRLARVHTSEAASTILAHAAAKLTNADYATVWLWDNEQCVLSLGAALPPIPASHPTTFNVLEQPALLTLRENPRPVVLTVGEDRPAHVELMQAIDVSTAAYVPVVARGELLGLVAVGFVGPETTPDPGLLERLGGLSDFASAALDNSRLLARVQHEASHDALTGLPNRTAIVARDASWPVPGASGLLFIDLNNFKEVNDSHGHRIGDQVLALVAARMSGSMRTGDRLARFAGDEFVVAVDGCRRREDLDDVADRIRACLAAPVLVEDKVIDITASIGMAFCPDDGDDFESLLNAADVSMYAQKDGAGRRHVVTES